MIKKIKQMLISSLALAMFAAPMAMVPVVHAATEFELQSGLCSGSNADITADPTASCDKTNGEAETKVNETIAKGLNLFSAVVGIIAEVMIIVGGIQYITTGGDSGNVTKAKNTILYAVIGLVVVALAQIIVQFVLSRFTG
ncbi:MAG: hypothetical protein QG628_579 [Patescibacteria group bacterium]|nr:hypothetical protein [Patescibacteria group bacterium]